MITQTKIALVSTSLAFAQDRAHAPRGDSSTATHYAEIRDGSWNSNTYEGGDWTRAGGAYRTNL